LGYLLLWRVGRPQIGFFSFLFEYSTREPRAWAPEGMPGLNDAALYVAALGMEVTGLIIGGAPFLWVHAAIGLVFAAVLGFAARMFRGTSPPKWLWPAALSSLGAQFAFYTWFEARNPKWWFVPLTVLAAAAAAGSRGAPVASRWARRLSAALLVIVAAAAWASFGPNLVWLRGRRNAIAVERSVALAAELGTNLYAVHVPVSWHPKVAFYLARVPAEFLWLPADPAEAVHEIVRRANEDRRPIILVADRFVFDGMPCRCTEDALGPWLECLPPSPKLRPLRLEGRVVAVGFLPE
jgi:hypothetical protein